MKLRTKLFCNAFGVLAVFLALSAFDFAMAQGAAAVAAVDPSVTRWAFIAAAVATGMSALAAGIAVAYVGSAAVGAISEKPEITGQALIFVGLAEGIAIYGLIISIMILGKIK
jgi:V/A-type H+/Na+-transporting ATPase subunit K